MTKLEIKDNKLVIKVLGADKLWALKSELTLPIHHILSAEYDPHVAEDWRKGMRGGGTGVPGVLTAGTFYKDGQKVFWDVHKPENTIVIKLRDESYSQLVIEVEDPIAELEWLNEMLQD
jgi:hypothetical protein